MAQEARATIKTYFQTGDVPTQSQFGNSFDSQVFWVDDVVTSVDNTSTDAEVPTAKAVFDLQTFTKDADDNVFYNGVSPTLGTLCRRNIFYQASGDTLGNGCQENVFYPRVSGITLGTDCIRNIFEGGTNSTFANNLLNVVVKSSTVGGGDYTNLTNYGFMYGNTYSAIIFGVGGLTNYHQYYDAANNRIVTTNLTTLAVTYISGGWTVVSANQVAVNDGQYTNVANATYTNPTPVEGKGYWVLVRNGTATINSVGYSTPGTIVYSVYHSGSWATYIQSAFNDATSSIQTQLNNKVDTFTVFSIIGTWASPADSLSYYAPIAGALTTPITTITTFLSSFNFACKIVGVFVQHLNNVGTQGSSENVAIQLRNNTTALSSQLINIQTNQASGVQKNFEDYTLNISIAANDSVALQINTPAWATNPTNVALRVTLFIQRT